MIKINVCRENDKLRIELCGHAGYGKAGKDIVCAGVSAIFYALANMDGVDSGEKGGVFFLVCEEKALKYAEVAICGWKLIAQEYPSCVDYKCLKK